jgi:hypothetical protein
MLCPTCGNRLTALPEQPRDEYCPRCETLWREDLHAWLDVDPSGGDARPRKLGPRSFPSEFRWCVARS